MPDSPEHEPNQILAMVKQGVTEENAKNAITDAGGSILKTSSNGRLTAILIHTSNIESTMKHLINSDCFQAVQLNYLNKRQ
ncbi:hypothetical protein BH10CYA1_BH10CYA1_44460 [soil metagenome]